jgi:hypothetical protein
MMLQRLVEPGDIGGGARMRRQQIRVCQQRRAAAWMTGQLQRQLLRPRIVRAPM